MPTFDYERSCSKLMIPSVITALTSVHEFRGRQSLYQRVASEALDKLCEVAKIQSTESSNRIENVSTTDVRLRELMLEKTMPQTRDEQEIVGYRYVLDMIHTSYPYISVTPNVILQLHRDLYRALDVSFAGRWKDSDNIIGQRMPDGKIAARFVPISAAATPAAMEDLCTAYAHALETEYDPLLPTLMFVFDFVSIHPFSDGNGRMSRLLTLLLLYRIGYFVGKYVSIEREIEQTKETYYEALGVSSIGWMEGEGDYVPFVSYMLGVIISCYKQLDERLLAISSSSNEEKILGFLDRALVPVTKQEMLDAIPTLSRRTLERVLSGMQKDGLVERVGAARSTAYIRRR